LDQVRKALGDRGYITGQTIAAQTKNLKGEISLAALDAVITVAISSTSTTAERGIEMFNIAAAAHLAELGRKIRTARTKLHWSQEAFAGSVAWSEAITEGSSRIQGVKPLA
jgi:hypothetical protein